MNMKVKRPANLKKILELMAKAEKEGAKVEFVNAETGEKGMPDELKEVLESMGCDSHSHGFVEEAAPATEKADHALLDIAAIHANPPKWERGQFVRYRPDVHYIKGARELHIVLDVLSTPVVKKPLSDDETGSCLAYRELTILLGCFQEGKGIRKWYADPRELELYPTEEIKKLLGNHGGN